MFQLRALIREKKPKKDYFSKKLRLDNKEIIFLEACTVFKFITKIQTSDWRETVISYEKVKAYIKE